MKITIDTKEENKEELKKLIALLTALVNEPVYTNSNDIFEKQESESEGTNAFSSMFGSSESQSTDEEESIAKKLKDKIVPY